MHFDLLASIFLDLEDFEKQVFNDFGLLVVKDEDNHCLSSLSAAGLALDTSEFNCGD